MSNHTFSISKLVSSAYVASRKLCTVMIVFSKLAPLVSRIGFSTSNAAVCLSSGVAFGMFWRHLSMMDQLAALLEENAKLCRTVALVEDSSPVQTYCVYLLQILQEAVHSQPIL